MAFYNQIYFGVWNVYVAEILGDFSHSSVTENDHGNVSQDVPWRQTKSMFHALGVGFVSVNRFLASG